MSTPNHDDAVFPADDAPTQEYTPAEPSDVSGDDVTPAPQAYAAAAPAYAAAPEYYDESGEDPDLSPDDEVEDSGSSVNWPTVMVAAGLAGLVSAIVLAIGLAGIVISDSASDNGTGATPTVVNLGAQQTQPVAPGAPVAPAAPAAPVGEDPAAAVPAAPAEPAAPVAPAAPAAPANPAAPAATAAPTGSAPTLALFQSQLRLLESNASTARKAQVLEGGAKAVPQMTAILNLVKSYSYTGFKYQLIAPVTQNGDSATVRLQMTLPGYDARYMTMKWVNVGGSWKLSNKSVCDLAAYAQQNCSVG